MLLPTFFEGDFAIGSEQDGISRIACIDRGLHNTAHHPLATLPGGAGKDAPATVFIGPTLNAAIRAILGKHHLHPSIERIGLLRDELEAEIPGLAVGKLQGPGPKVSLPSLGTRSTPIRRVGQIAADHRSWRKPDDRILAIIADARRLEVR